MALGLSVGTANGILGALSGSGSSFASATFYIQLHTGDPGADGTANQSSMTTRKYVVFHDSSAGSVTLSYVENYFTMTGTETISHISAWDSSSYGNFRMSAILTSPIAVVNGSTISFSTLTISVTTKAA